MSEISRTGGLVPARRRVSSNLSKPIDALLLWLQRYRERRMLGSLSDHMLKDIGFSRADIDVEARKAFWPLKGAVMLPKIDARERDTIIAALRAWQSEPRLRQSFYYVATGGGAQTPLTEAELDALCRRLDVTVE